MEQEQKKVPRPRLTKAQIQNFLREFEASFCTVKDFCDQRSINPITFHKWKSRHKIRISAKEQGSNFVPVEVVASSPTSSSLFAEVGRIKIYQPVSAEFLKELSA